MATVQRLSYLVTARIKSSASLNSFDDVVLGLMRNSLDANATTIDIVIDLMHAYCSIEDNGNGIAPEEFPGSTFKPRDSGAFGHSRSFIANLSALSRVTFVSKMANRSVVSRSVLEHAAICERRDFLPQDTQELGGKVSGTKVTAQNIFTCLPFRMKEQTQKQIKSFQKDWDKVKRGVLGTILAWQKELRINMYEKYFHWNIQFAGNTPSVPVCRGFDLQYTFSVFKQIGGIPTESKSSWVPILGSK